MFVTVLRQKEIRVGLDGLEIIWWKQLQTLSPRFSPWCWLMLSGAGSSTFITAAVKLLVSSRWRRWSGSDWKSIVWFLLTPAGRGSVSVCFHSCLLLTGFLQRHVSRSGSANVWNRACLLERSDSLLCCLKQTRAALTAGSSWWIHVCRGHEEIQLSVRAEEQRGRSSLWWNLLMTRMVLYFCIILFDTLFTSLSVW